MIIIFIYRFKMITTMAAKEKRKRKNATQMTYPYIISVAYLYT